MSTSFVQLQPTVLISVTELRVRLSFVKFVSSPQEKERKNSLSLKLNFGICRPNVISFLIKESISSLLTI
jgi:hypothetical protein